MEPITCRYYVATGQIRRYLRRYVSSDTRKCPKSPDRLGYTLYCDAQQHLDDIVPEPIDGIVLIRHYEWDHNDPRWPKACEHCGTPFSDSDEWQVHTDWLYRDASDLASEPVALMRLPVGSIWEQPWGHGPDSIYLLQRHIGDQLGPFPHLFCRTPGGVWDMDTTSSKGQGWQVTGTPPRITVTPSILHSRGGWHGWLRDGILTQC
jgi:hypothetical protein